MLNISKELEKASKNGGADIRKVYYNFKNVLETNINIDRVSSDFTPNSIVLIGGGSGVSTVGRSLYKIGIPNFTSIASVMDVGGGSGVVQDAFGIPHMNDVMQHLININPIKNDLANFMALRTSYAWKQDGYLVLAAAIEMFGMGKGVDFISHSLENIHRSLPVTEQPCEPIFTYRDVKYGTYEFAFLHGRIGVADHTELNIAAKILPEASISIRNADIVILGPGDVHFSILPPILITETREALDNIRKVILVANLTAREIDIPGFTLKNFISFWKERLPKKPEYHIIVNSSLNINQENRPLKDDVQGDCYKGYYIHRAAIAGVSVSRNQQLLHDETMLGEFLFRLIKA